MTTIISPRHRAAKPRRCRTASSLVIEPPRPHGQTRRPASPGSAGATRSPDPPPHRRRRRRHLGVDCRPERCRHPQRVHDRTQLDQRRRSSLPPRLRTRCSRRRVRRGRGAPRREILEVVDRVLQEARDAAVIRGRRDHQRVSARHFVEKSPRRFCPHAHPGAYIGRSSSRAVSSMVWAPMMRRRRPAHTSARSDDESARIVPPIPRTWGPAGSSSIVEPRSTRARSWVSAPDLTAV